MDNRSGSVFCLILLLVVISDTGKCELKFEVNPNAYLSIKTMISKNGYPVEDHYVTTKDEYILHLFRIPHGREGSDVHRKPVLLMHGLQGSAENFIVAGPEIALSYRLAEQGYDVWLGNARGNLHSRNHTIFHPDTNMQFWQFSWHEIGTADLPAMIDYILMETNQLQLNYIGHSQGGTSFLVLMSERPEYNKKIKLGALLGPNVLNRHFVHPYINLLVKNYRYIWDLINSMQLYEMLPFNQSLNLLLIALCQEVTYFREICARVISVIGGENLQQLDRSLIPVIVSKSPAGASTLQMIHYLQLIISGEFRKFDFGLRGNLLKYQQLTPPLYNLRNVTAPVALFYGRNDWLTSYKDIERLGFILPNVVKMHPVMDDKFSHLDFLWANYVGEMVYDPLMDLMEQLQET